MLPECSCWLVVVVVVVAVVVVSCLCIDPIFFSLNPFFFILGGSLIETIMVIKCSSLSSNEVWSYEVHFSF